MNRFPTLFMAAVVTLLASASPTHAQVSPDSIVGEHIRLMTRDARDRKFVGQALRVDEGRIYLREHVGAPETSISIDSITRLDIRTRQRRDPLKNAAIGIVSGSMAGVALYSMCDHNEDICRRDAFVTGGVLAAAGALVGFIYGTTHANVWEQSHLADLGLTVSQNGGLRLTASF